MMKFILCVDLKVDSVEQRSRKIRFHTNVDRCNVGINGNDKLFLHISYQQNSLRRMVQFPKSMFTPTSKHRTDTSKCHGFTYT